MIAFVPAPRPEASTMRARRDLLRGLAIGDQLLEPRCINRTDVQACLDVSHAALESDLPADGNLINGSEH
jgi:hypothetical protein